MPTPRTRRGTRPSLSVARPDLARQATDPATASLTLGSNKRVEWRCERGHTFSATPYDRTTQSTGCPYCSGRLAVPGETDLATTHPLVAQQLRDADPRTVCHGSRRQHVWECERGHTFTATPNNRTSKASQCPYCVGRLPIPGETDLATTHPHIAAQAVDVDPSTVSRGSNKAVTWRCELGHRWTATPNTRVNMGSGCPFCVGKRILPGFNDLATKYPTIAAEARGVRPDTLSPTSGVAIEWCCGLCNGRWIAAPATRTRLGESGCATCRGGSGFRVSRPAYLYLLGRAGANGEERKVGVTNNPQVRISQYRRFGWRALDVSPLISGSDALAYEQDFLRHLDDSGVPRGARRSASREPGFTETWNAADYFVGSIAEITNAVRVVRTT